MDVFVIKKGIYEYCMNYEIESIIVNRVIVLIVLRIYLLDSFFKIGLLL